VAFCRVTYRDIDRIEHSVEVDAESLYEAVASAVKRFRNDDGWASCPPGSACNFDVRVLPHSPITYSIALNKVQEFAFTRYCQRSKGDLADEAHKRVAWAQLRVPPLSAGEHLGKPFELERLGRYVPQRLKKRTDLYCDLGQWRRKTYG
jgi:hypothetical protein